MRRRGVSCVAGLALAGVMGWSADSFAASTDVPMFLVKPGEIKIDGVLKEWGADFTRLSNANQGTAAGTAMSGAIAYDDKYIYVAGEVTDPKLVRTSAYGPNEDRAELVLTFPDANGEYRTVYEVALYAGDPGKTAGQVKAAGLGVVATATLVEAPARGGYTFEAQIPWNLFPPAARTRVALRGALRYYDSNGGAVTTILSTADKGRAASLPFLPNAAEQSVRKGLLQQKGIIAPPSRDLIANVAGDEMNERVLLYDRYIVVLGPRFRDGAEYYWSDLAVDPSRGGLPLFEVRDLTGDGRAEIVLRKKVDIGTGSREMLQVLSFTSGAAPTPVFEHETGISSTVGSIQNDVRIEAAARGAAITISLGASSGYDSTNYNEPTETAREPLLLPWGTVRSRTFAWNGKQFDKTGEQNKPAGDTGSRPAGPPPPPAPRPPTADELLDQVFALYKKDHSIAPTAVPSFDFVTNVAEDETNERIVCHGRDLVVFGKAFREGRGYVSLSMPQFSSPSDIADVTARDLTGDGLADVIVRGVQKVTAPAELGEGDITREVFFAYTVSPERITRVFAAETAINMGDRRIQSTIAFLAGRPGLDIEIRPGRAIGWERASWPYKQDSEAVSGVEPIVLPWTPSAIHYRFNGSSYSR